MPTRRTALTLIGSALALPLLGTQAQAAKTHTIRISGHSFSPRKLNAKVGDTVTFMNRDSALHTGTARNGAFDTGRLQQGQAAQVSLTAAGQIDYFCAVHPSMTGVILVS